MSTTIRVLTPYENQLHDAAIRKTGFDDFGDPEYRQGLRVLFDAFDTHLQLSETGWKVAYGMFLRMLTGRLYAQKGWAEHPEVLAIPIHRPVVITGLPRTGTTALHRLLSVDPQFQGLETWLSQTPLIRPARETWETHPAYRACVESVEERCTRTPEILKAHHFAADEVEECTGVLLQNFVSSFWGVAYPLPTYARWCLSQSARNSYRRYADVLRLIGARESHKRWLLKSPFHMAEIDTLLQVFPDACIIQTHRDPLKAIPSVCSLFNMYAQDLEGAAAQPHVIGPRQCAHWRKALDCMQTAHQKLPMKFFDVDHRNFRTDPLGTVRSIYEYFSLTLSRNTEQQMRAWVAASPTTRHGNHQYTVDSWGVTQAQISDAFGNYRARHQFN